LFRSQSHQFTHCRPSPGKRHGLQALGNTKQEQDHRRFWPLPEQECTDDSQHHQKVNIQNPGTQGNPAFAQNRPATGKNRQEGEKRQQPAGKGRQIAPGQGLGSEGKQPGQDKPDRKGRLGLSQRLGVALIQYPGLHSDTVKGSNNSLHVRQGMLDRQYTLDKIELQAGNTLHPLQRLFNQSRFGRAIHCHDVQTRTGTHIHTGQMRSRRNLGHRAGSTTAVCTAGAVFSLTGIFHRGILLS